MKKLGNFLMIGAAATVAAAILAGPVLARDLHMHEMTMRLPDGGVAHIRYAGNTPPQVSFDDFALRNTGFSGALPADPFTGPFADPFADMERISAAMDRQAAQMMRLANADFSAASPQALEARLGELPRGAAGYSVYSVTSGGKTCTERMAFGYDSHGKPVVQKASAGNCAVVSAPADHAPSYHVSNPAPRAPSSGVKVIEAAL